jgi:hypothetical protein
MDISKVHLYQLTHYDHLLFKMKVQNLFRLLCNNSQINFGFDWLLWHLGVFKLTTHMNI